jgi:NhaP-type Na+/H+ or K+/H+ antiporter
MIEIAGIIVFGIFAQWLAWKIKVPAILPLILIGLLVGPISTLWTESGEKILSPIYNEETGRGLFPGQYLFYFVSLAIGIILFEGGLTLKRKELQGVGPTIGKLISLGSLITFIGAGFAAHFIMNLNWSISFLFASLIIVTGPTVIAPILQNVPLNRNVATVLKWEGILIDPIGALAAVLMYEFIISGQGSFEFTSHALLQFIEIVLIGLALGTLAAFFLYYLLKNELIPHFLLNVFTLALVLLIFVFSDLLAHESGLLTVVVMGMVLGNLDVPRLKEILYFKESLSVLLISILFILLAANIRMEELLLIMDWRSLVLFLVVIFVLRPLGVFASTRAASLNVREKLYISWVGPRGIVAAGVASLFYIRLINDNVPDAEYIKPLVFLIVLGTVLLNATTAKPFAKWLRVIQEDSNGILIVGAHKAARVIAKYLKNNDRHVVLVDSSESNINQAEEEGLEAFRANIFTDTLDEYFDLLDMGYLVAMTSSSDVNSYAVRKYQNIFGEKGTFRLITPIELSQDKEALPAKGIFSYTDDYLNLNEVARDFPSIHEVPISSNEEMGHLLDKLDQFPKSIPLFIKYADGFIDLIPADRESLAVVETGSFLIYMGREADLKAQEELQATPGEA